MKSRRIILLYGPYIFAFGLAGGVLYDIHRAIPLAICFVFGAVFCCGKAHEAELIEDGSEPESAKKCGRRVIILGIIFSAFLGWLEWGPLHNDSSPKSHLQLALRVVGETGWPLMITNAIFSVPQIPSSNPNVSFIRGIDIKGAVVIQVPLTAHSVPIELALFNNSGDIIEAGFVKVGIYKTAHFVPSPLWTDDSTAEDLFRRWIVMRTPKLEPKVLFSLPAIQFTMDEKNFIPLHFMASIKGDRVLQLGMRLFFTNMADHVKPFASSVHIAGTKRDGSPIFETAYILTVETNALGQPEFHGYGKFGDVDTAKNSKNKSPFIGEMAGIVLICCVVGILIISIIVYAIRS